MERKPPKLKFDRLEISKRMKDIIDKHKPLCARVSPMLTIELQASNSATIQHNAMDQPKTTPYSGGASAQSKPGQTGLKNVLLQASMAP